MPHVLVQHRNRCVIFRRALLGTPVEEGSLVGMRPACGEAFLDLPQSPRNRLRGIAGCTLDLPEPFGRAA